MSANDAMYAENLVRSYVLEHLEKTDKVPDDRYYEVTRNEARAETYIDCYVKLENVALTDEMLIRRVTET